MIRLIFLWTLLLVFNFSHSQNNVYEGYLICKDKYGEPDRTANNSYYYLPLNYRNLNNDTIHKSTIEDPEDGLELNIRKKKGYKFFQDLYRPVLCDTIEKIPSDTFVENYMNFIYFHYDPDLNRPTDKYFIKKINKYKFYVAKIRFEGCIINDPNYISADIPKLFIQKIIYIEKIDCKESKDISKFINESLEGVD
ncbi:hypothetical protein [Aequorivita antarctica]|uniref:Uncharacterized protein n=2 Tax=Aequorivita antarctica TaxID=153266 RepID=A0A5C6Z090_9FLAO|nr:hypothetical protein [Aequorivita antarctica]TXD72791.1 hypothetical protein ESU54_11280 [Aequorivita antarctica]